MIPNEFMLAISLSAMMLSLTYGLRVEVKHGKKERKSFVVAMWALPLLWLSIFYGTLVAGIEPFRSDATLRTSFFRPGQFGLLLLISVFLANGRINAAISRGLETWNSIYKTCFHW